MHARVICPTFFWLSILVLEIRHNCYSFSPINSFPLCSIGQNVCGLRDRHMNGETQFNLIKYVTSLWCCCSFVLDSLSVSDWNYLYSIIIKLCLFECDFQEETSHKHSWENVVIFVVVNTFCILCLAFW